MTVSITLYTALFLLPFMTLVLLRNLVFNLVWRVFSKSHRFYLKSRKVDVGLVFMFSSIVIGVAVFTAIPTLSVDAAILIVIGICCLGALILATGIMAEWEANK